MSNFKFISEDFFNILKIRVERGTMGTMGSNLYHWLRRSSIFSIIHGEQWGNNGGTMGEQWGQIFIIDLGDLLSSPSYMVHFW